MINLNCFGSMEAVNFQSYSPLGNDLTKIFQEVITYRDSLTYENIPPTWEARAAYRDAKMIAFCKNTMAPKLLSAIKKNTNVTINHIVFYHNSDPETTKPTFTFAISGCISDTCTSLARLYRATGWGSNAEKYYNSAEGNILEDINSLSELLDIKNAKLLDNVGTKPSAIPIFIDKLFFDITSSFLIRDYVKVKEEKDFTARELAALVMHEIGHVITAVEHSSDLYVRCERVKNNLVTLVKHEKFKETAKILNAVNTKLINKVVSCISTVDKVGEIKNSFIKFCINTSAAFEVLTAVIKKINPENEVHSSLKIATAVVINTITVLINTVFILIRAMIGVALAIMFSAFFNVVNTLKNIVTEKISDRTTNANNVFLQERWADEFVARCGYGEYLASALGKINYFKRALVTKYNGEIYRYRPTQEISWYNTFVSICTMWAHSWYNLFGLIGDPEYEALYDRIKRILQDSKAIFKNDDLGAELALEWIDRCEMIKKEADKRKSLKDTEFYKTMANTIRNLMIIHPDNLYNLILDCKLSRDCAILENRLDDLNNTSLYMLSYKFKVQTY